MFLKGSFPVRLELDGRRPLYTFQVEWKPIEVRSTTAQVDDEEWTFRLSRRRASLRDSQNAELAEARRVSSRPTRWIVADGPQSFEMMVEATKRGGATVRGRQKDHRRFLQLLPTGAAGRPVGSVRVAYLAAGFMEGLGNWKWSGRFEARIHLESSVSLPIVILAVRLALGDWAKKAPRVGEWTVTSPN